MKYRFQIGASLIEVLIAVVIVGFSLLGIVGMQATSVAMTGSSYYRGVAVDLGVDLAERIKALKTPYLATADATTQPVKPPDFSKCIQNDDSNPTCSNQDADRSTYQALMNSEMTSWNNLRISQLPPDSTYTLTAVQSGTSSFLRYTLTLTWLDDSKSDTSSSYTVVIE